ncbi:MAG: hypothetical protein KC422_25970 [Trueperaceae bacterium]|nr:hypothetical protein [Trueperaceae bacterium]
MDYVAHFFAALFLVNGVPHFVQGVSGNRFQSPFAKPPGVGESSPESNVLWGSANFIVGSLLLNVVTFELGFNVHSLVFLVGALAMAFFLARYFGRVRNK